MPIMRIAFDLDDTLIPSCPSTFLVEKPRGFLGRWFAEEYLRQGTTELLHALVEHGCDIWVYTTSLRSPRYIKRLFRCYGVRLGGVVNQDIHWEWLQRQPSRYRCSKYPPAFGIDLLVDDLEGVYLEGQQFHFRVVHVRPDEESWTAKIIAEVNKSLARPVVLEVAGAKSFGETISHPGE